MTTAEHLGPEATELDAEAFDQAVEFIHNEEWLWNNGDFFDRLSMVANVMVACPEWHVFEYQRTIMRAWLMQNGGALS